MEASARSALSWSTRRPSVADAARAAAVLERPIIGRDSWQPGRSGRRTPSDRWRPDAGERRRCSTGSARTTPAMVRSGIDVAVALDEELAGGGVGVDELRQQRDAHRHRHADGELLPARQRRRIAACGVAAGTGRGVADADVGGLHRLVGDRNPGRGLRTGRTGDRIRRGAHRPPRLPRGGGGGEHPALHRREPGHDVDQRHEHHDGDERELHQRRAALPGDQAEPRPQPPHGASSTARPVTSTGSSAPSPASSVGTAPAQRTTTSVSPLASTSCTELHTSPSAVCGEVARATTATVRSAPADAGTSALAANRAPSCALAITTLRTCTYTATCSTASSSTTTSTDTNTNSTTAAPCSPSSSDGPSAGERTSLPPTT